MSRKPYTYVTTSMAREIARLASLGLNDDQIGGRIGVSPYTARIYRKQAGIAPAGRSKVTIYTVWDAKTDEVLACGTAAECAAKLGLAKPRSFYYMAHHAANGRRRRYVVTKEIVPRTALVALAGPGQEAAWKTLD